MEGVTTLDASMMVRWPMHTSLSLFQVLDGQPPVPIQFMRNRHNCLLGAMAHGIDKAWQRVHT